MLKRTLSFLIVVVAAASPSDCLSQVSSNGRDAALKRIAACEKRNEVASKECRTLNADVDYLVSVYQHGDKSVLPTLLKFTYLTNFYGEALLANPEEFLSAVANLSEPDQQQVLSGVGGQMWGVRRRERFEALRSRLRGIPESSTNHDLARRCLTRLETLNAEFLVEYFPPQTFTSRAAAFQVHWYSRDMYGLREKPLWPPASDAPITYRLTVIPAFSAPMAVTLTILPDGSADVTKRTTDEWHEQLKVEKRQLIDARTVASVLSEIQRADFWQLPVEIERRGHDGAEWILEGIQDGKYHIVVRWSPEKTPFAKAAESLLELAEPDLKTQ